MSWKIPFGELEIGEETRGYLNGIVDKDWASEGELVKEFEKKWGKLFEYKHNVMVTSGTVADTIACSSLYDFNAKRSVDMQHNQIIVPALAFAAAGSSVVQAGFEPIFVDVEKETMNINPNLIEDSLTNKTRAIMAVHTMGRPCEMDKIMKISNDNNLYVIEDSCEAHGAKFKDKFVGQWGDMATFSYYAAHLVCCGEGGMISTNNDSFAESLKSVKSHGRPIGSIYFSHERIGMNGKTTDLAAAVGLPQVDYFWRTFNVRKKNLNYLLGSTEDLEKYAWFTSERPGEQICPHAFSITLKDPEYNIKELSDFLEDGGKGIQCKRNFGSMPTQHQAFKFLGHKLGEYPEAEYIGDNGLHFGIHQHISKEDLNYASDRLHEYFEKIS
jgi:dTDP-4-amino-4,6-dideoxygalactose transaminase